MTLSNLGSFSGSKYLQALIDADWGTPHSLRPPSFKHLDVANASWFPLFVFCKFLSCLCIASLAFKILFFSANAFLDPELLNLLREFKSPCNFLLVLLSLL